MRQRFSFWQHCSARLLKSLVCSAASGRPAGALYYSRLARITRYMRCTTEVFDPSYYQAI